MSVIAHSVKLKFSGFLRKLFGKFETNGHASSPPAASQLTTAPAASASGSTRSVPVASSSAQSGNGKANGNGVHIPLQAIIATLPLELRSKVRQTDVGDLTFTVAFEKVLSQLASGKVKVTFGEIRRLSPQVFTMSTDCDAVAVALPLESILSQLNPALLVRRPAQKQVDVPADIVSPFGAQGQGLFLSADQAKAEPRVAPPLAAPTPPMRMVPVTPAVRARSSFVPPPLDMPEQIFQRAPAAPISSAPSLPSVTPAVPVTPATTLPGPKDFLSAPPVARSVQPAQPTTPAVATPTLSVSLASLAEGWPEALRQEIVQLNLVEARLALPVGLVGTSLKRGRVVFPWKTLRSWIRPAPLPSVSAHDAAELELPLSVLAPLFLARQNAEAKPQQRVAIDEAIPNLFFGLPKPEPASAQPGTAAVAKPADTNYYVWNDVAETARVDETEVKRKAPTGTDFVARCATPNEIVSRTAALDGVAGALVALPDGLMVANQIPPELNGDTLAAFLPQIFSKVSQTTRELRMGELNNLNFTVGNVPWKIFRVNAIFFAAFGRAGEPLPTAQLAALAAELDRKNK